MGENGQKAVSDTSFRRTWDRNEYAQRAREVRNNELGGIRGNMTDASARNQRLDVSNMVGKTQFVPVGASFGRKGRGAGFYCDACDMTFKDNVQLVEHLNSKGHLIRAGQTSDVCQASVEEVRERLRLLKEQKVKNMPTVQKLWELRAAKGNEDENVVQNILEGTNLHLETRLADKEREKERQRLSKRLSRQKKRRLAREAKESE